LAAKSRRALALDALSAVLPLMSRDRLAELLSEGEVEVETLRHLAREGMGANTIRAIASDLAYLEAWSLAASGADSRLADRRDRAPGRLPLHRV
jgi:hypothetical protein